MAVLSFALEGLSDAAGDHTGVWWARTPPSIEEVSGGKLHVGDKITKDNVDLVKHHMPEAFYLDTKDGAVWEIAPSTPGEKLIPPDLVKTTIENEGKAIVKENGTVLTQGGRPWIGGFPVPEPKTGIEVMANRQFKTADGHADQGKLEWVNPQGVTYKETIVNVRAINTTARVCQDPKPVLPGFEDQIARELLVFTDPYDVKGLSVLTVIYVDQNHLPDAWGYVPVLRRVQRFSSGQRYDSIDGSDLRAGDIDTFSDPLGMWDFNLTDRAFMFSVLTGGDKQAGARPQYKDMSLIKGRYPADARVELRDTYLVEARPKDTSHIYSKKLLFIDAATYWSWLGQFYDRQGKLWYQFSLWFRRLENDCGNFPSLTWVPIINYQTGSATLALIPFYYRNPTKDLMNADMFSLKFIMSQGR